MSGRWRRLLLVAAIGGIASASVGPVSAEGDHESSCPYERAREAAAATAAASGAAFSLFDLSRSADGLTP
ncbi:hypothetical protein [Sphingomonas agri]|uniref:hypothetical protein n=1 Tax=Sphingomonas agri TaxID=1813878 RepID=UPI00311F4BA2